MDATVFSPIVDMKFINNTPHHILIENYYSEENEASDLQALQHQHGPRGGKDGAAVQRRRARAEEDVWEYDPDLPEGTVVQIDTAVEGAQSGRRPYGQEC